MSFIINPFIFGAPAGIADPTDIPGLVLWMDPLDDTTFRYGGTLQTAGDTYTYSVSPHASYPDTGGLEMTDGLVGTTSFANARWAGWFNAAALTTTFDLGVATHIGYGRVHSLKDTTSGIDLITALSLEYSDDGSSWTLGGTVSVTTGSYGTPTVNWLTVNVDGDAGAHRYWRFVTAGAGIFQFHSEMELYGSTTAARTVSAWTDKSTNGFVITQATEANRPTTGSRTIGGLNALDFTPNDHLFRTATQIVNSSDGNWTAFMVASVDVDALAIPLDQDPGSGNRVAQFFRWNAGSVLQSLVWNTAGTIYADSAGTPVINTPYVFSAVRGSASIETRLNGSSPGGATATAGTNRTNAVNLTIGAYAGGVVGTAAYLNGLIGEVIIYNRALTASEVGQVEAYLANLRGISL